MTSTERSRRSRAKQRIDKPTDAATIAALKARIRELEAGVAPQPADPLSKTAQGKLDAAIRVRLKALEREFERRVQGEVKERMAIANAAVTKHSNELHEREKWLREFIAKQKKMGTMADWNNLMVCLHPDTRRTASDKKFDDALRWVMARKFAITGEK